MSEKKALLGAVQAAAADTAAGNNKDDDDDGDGRYAKLLAIVKRHSSRKDDLNLREVFQTVSKSGHQKLWEGMLNVVQPIVQEGKFSAEEAEHATSEQLKMILRRGILTPVDMRRKLVVLLFGTTKKAPGLDRKGHHLHRPIQDEAQDTTIGEGDASADVGGNGETPEVPAGPSTPDTSLFSVGEPDAGNTCPRRPARGRHGGGAPAGGTSGKKRSADVSLALEVLLAVATLAQEFIADGERVAPRPLLDTMVYMHDIMLSLQGLQGLALQSLIAKVCEMWWTQERLGGEHLVPQLLPLMLVRSLDEDAKEADVKRLYGLRAALLVLDFDDESSLGLRTLLLRLFVSPICLKCSEGKRLLAYLFGLHPSLVLDIHEVMKGQMPGAKRTVLAAYGEVYFKVWRGAEADKKTTYLEKIEMHCLQDLMHACIHASTPKMHANLLTVLDGLHSQKKVKGVDAALLRLYGPVLWRALRVANPVVRAQACQVLVDAFPLQDPAASAAAYDSVLQEQFDALTSLLEDAHPQVRAVAAKGSCRILSVFWEMVPRDTARALLTRVVGKLASDGSSPLVRLGAVEGLTILLQCTESHSVLKAMLPGVSNIIHDSNKKVRVAFVKLLSVVKAGTAMRYYQVVPVDHLLARLAVDHLKCPASADGLAKLILNSYFPTGADVTGSVQVHRCLTLLDQDEAAATAFYSRLHEYAGVPSSSKMLAMLVRCALFAARTSEEGGGAGIGSAAEERGAKRRGKRKGLEGGKESGGGGGKGSVTLRASDSKRMSAVLNLISTIWESILPALEKSVNEPSLELIQETVTGEALALLHSRFSRGDERCRGAFMRLAGLAGGDLAPEMLEDVVVEMLSLPADAPLSVYGPTVDLLCSWGQHEHLMGAVLDSLKRALVAGASGSATATSDAAVPSPAPTRGSRGKRRRPVSARNGNSSGVGHDHTPAHGLPPALALSMLNHLLAGGHGHTATTFARDAIFADDESAGSLEDTLALARTMADRRLSPIAAKFTPGDGGFVGSVAGPKAAMTNDNAIVEEGYRRCPDALLVRAIEALGRVYMHREAALAGDDHGRDAQDEDDQQAAETMLLPMPFSAKMRELMVWTTGTVLPFLGGVGGADTTAEEDAMAADGTPVKSAPDVTAMSPSPMPPPRSRARGDNNNNDDDKVKATARATVERNGNSDSNSSASTNVIGARAAKLAASVLGVVVLLAAEWVEVGSGLAEVSLRADTWGQRLLSLLLGDNDCRERVATVLPALCRLSHQLSVRESQGARPPESIWEVLLRCADCGVPSKRQQQQQQKDDGEEEGRKDDNSKASACVQKFLAASVALQGRRGGLPFLAERLLTFVFTQASPLGNDQDEDGIERDALSVDSFTRLCVRAHDESRGSAILGVSRPGAAVFASIVRFAQLSKATGALALSHLCVFRPGENAGDASWPLFCAHVVGALLDHAPAKARLELAAGAHSALKAAASSQTQSDNDAGIEINHADDDGDGDGGASRRRSDGQVSFKSTENRASWVLRAIFGRLEAARQSAVGGGGEVGRVVVPGGQGRRREGTEGGGVAAMCSSPDRVQAAA